jgi:hypothetical protein
VGKGLLLNGLTISKWAIRQLSCVYHLSVRVLGLEVMYYARGAPIYQFLLLVGRLSP